jgi:hypothetical protein
MFVLDVTATVLIVMAFMLLTNDEMGPGLGGWIGLATAAAGGTMMIGSLVLSLILGPEEDEYARRLAGLATMIGFFVTITGYVIWRPLAGDWVPTPNTDQVMGLLFGGTGLGYFVFRVRGTW